MADSDDEFDRRNGRDKFRHERSDYDRRDDRRPPPTSRETWEDRASWANRNRVGDRRDGFRDFDRNRRFSPPRDGGSPPHMKRMRGEWEDGGFPPPPRFDMPPPLPYLGGPMHVHPPPHLPPPPPGTWGAPGVEHLPLPHFQMPLVAAGPRGGPVDSDQQTQPPMMSFKLFLNSQDDNITDEEAVKRYADYKADFRRHQMNEFFLKHKEQEWFKSKYHPEAYNRRIEETKKSLQSRVQIFLKLMDLGRLDQMSLDIGCSDEVVRLLNAAVILLEGGTEFDLTVLDVKSKKSPQAAVSQNSLSRRQSQDALVADNYPKYTEPLKLDANVKLEVSSEDNTTDDKTAKVSLMNDKTAEGYVSESGSISDSDDDDEKTMAVKKEDSQNNSDNKNRADGPEEGEDIDEPKPRPLHLTSSIFLRNIAPAATKQEIEEVCKRYPGYLRVALQDPQRDKKFVRRGWVTFAGSVNIKEICWNLQSVRVKDSDMGAIVNAELKQRIRTVTGITAHRTIARQDIKHSAKIIQNLDKRWNLWDETLDEKKDKEKELYGFASNNPILKNITDHLVDEGNYEEQVLLGEDGMEKNRGPGGENGVDQDSGLLQALDKLILYLRIVHSLDFYSASEYQNEDEMPHRCGMMHVRGGRPSGKINQTEINEYLSSFEQRIKPFLELKNLLDDTEMIKFGRKDIDQEVEKFILANTQEIGKEKWLCPLSGKKFKGADFVRKHILTKHTEKIDEVKNEVMYYNNYIRDPRRPELPEHPTCRPPPPSGARDLPPPPHSASYHGVPPGPLPHMAYRPPGPPMMYPPGAPGW